MLPIINILNSQLRVRNMMPTMRRKIKRTCAFLLYPKNKNKIMTCDNKLSTQLLILIMQMFICLSVIKHENQIYEDNYC